MFAPCQPAPKDNTGSNENVLLKRLLHWGIRLRSWPPMSIGDATHSCGADGIPPATQMRTSPVYLISARNPRGPRPGKRRAGEVVHDHCHRRQRADAVDPRSHAGHLGWRPANGMAFPRGGGGRTTEAAPGETLHIWAGGG